MSDFIADSFSSHTLDKASLWLSNNAFPLVLLNADNSIVNINKAFSSKLGYTIKEVVGRMSLSEITVISGEKELGLMHTKLFNHSYLAEEAKNFIALKSKEGLIYYFFVRTIPFDQGFRLLFLYDHSGPFSELSNVAVSDVPYRQIFDSFPGIVFVFDHTFKIIDVNHDTRVTLLDKTMNIKGKSIDQLRIPSFLKDLTASNLKKCLKSNKEIVFDYSLFIDDVVKLFRCRMIPNDNFILALINDVTSEREELMHASEKRQAMSDMFNDMPVAVAETDEEGRLLYANKTFTELIVTAGLLPQNFIEDYVGAEMFGVLKANGKNHHLHCIRLGRRYVDIASKKRQSESGLRYLFTIIDVTEREESKNALVKTEFSYKRLVETSPSGILIRDEKKVYYANPEALRILGFDNVSKIDLSKIMSKRDLWEINQRLLRVKVGESVDFEEFTIHPAGKKEPLIIETKPVLVDYDGKQVYQIVFRNVSIEKQLKEERLKKQLLEEHNQKLLNEIAYRIEIENELKKTVDENVLLLNEVHHRVKNNYQVISSMLNRYQGSDSNDALIQAISDIRGRLVSMSVVNDFILDAENYNEISLVSYLKKIYEHFARENGSAIVFKRIKFSSGIRNLVVNIADATPIGLIFNEILTILLKLVMQLNDNNCNFVTLKWQNRNTLEFIVKFDPGVAEHLKKELEHSLPASVINDFLEQLNGHLVCHCEKAELQLIVKLSKK